MKRCFVLAVVFGLGLAAVMTFAAAARAESDAEKEAAARGVTIGRIPVLWVGPAGGLTFTSFDYVHTDAYLVEPPERTQVSQSRDTGSFGPEVRLRLDAEKVLFHVDGFVDVIGLGDLMFSAHGGIVFGALLGGRSAAKLAELAGVRETRYSRTEEYRIHLTKETPLVYGVYLGASAMGMRAIDIVAERSDYDVNGNSIEQKLHRDANILVTAEAGFAISGAQIELLLAPAFEITHMKPGLRWVFQYALPIGPFPMYTRMTGEHLFGSDLPMGANLQFALGIGTSMGVSPSDS